VSGSTLSGVQSRVPDEWRVPIVFVLLWVGPWVIAVAHPSWWYGRLQGHAAEVPAAFGLLFALVGSGALLGRDRVAWWILVVLFVGGIAIWVQHVVSHGLGIAWTLWGVLTFVSFALLVSAPMRRFVRLRGRLAPGPS
jgi:hypothetical protein